MQCQMPDTKGPQQSQMTEKVNETIWWRSWAAVNQLNQIRVSSFALFHMRFQWFNSLVSCDAVLGKSRAFKFRSTSLHWLTDWLLLVYWWVFYLFKPSNTFIRYLQRKKVNSSLEPLFTAQYILKAARTGPHILVQLYQGLDIQCTDGMKKHFWVTPELLHLYMICDKRSDLEHRPHHLSQYM